jgi:hypothetical protein
MLAVLASGVFIWWWMHRYCPEIIVQIRQRYNMIVVDPAHYSLILNTMISNALIATSFVQIYYRVFFL